MKSVLILTAMLCLGTAHAAEYTSYEKCLEDHRENLDVRNEVQKCKNGAGKSECHRKYAEDYINAATECRKKFSTTSEKNTLPEDGIVSDCSASTRAAFDATAESCQALAEAAGTRCKAEDSKRIIELAGKKSTTNMQQSGASTQQACEQNKAFYQEAQSAMEKLAATCEPAITEGTSVCERARSVTQATSCPAATKAKWNQTISMGFSAISSHRQTLNDARSSVDAAKTNVADSNSCTQNSAASTPSTPSSAAAASEGVAPDPATAASTNSNPYAPGTEITPATAIRPYSESAEENGGGGATAAAAPKGGNELWDLPPSSASSGAAAMGGTMGSDLQKGSGSSAAAAAAEAKKPTMKATSDTTGGGGRGGGRTPVYGRHGGPKDFASAAEADRTPANKEGNPDLSGFLPGFSGPRTPCSAINPAGITGPHCSQFDKIHQRYSEMLPGLDPNL